MQSFIPPEVGHISISLHDFLFYVQWLGPMRSAVLSDSTGVCFGSPPPANWMPLDSNYVFPRSAKNAFKSNDVLPGLSARETTELGGRKQCENALVSRNVCPVNYLHFAWVWATIWCVWKQSAVIHHTHSGQVYNIDTRYLYSNHTDHASDLILLFPNKYFTTNIS